MTIFMPQAHWLWFYPYLFRSKGTCGPSVGSCWSSPQAGQVGRPLVSAFLPPSSPCGFLACCRRHPAMPSSCAPFPWDSAGKESASNAGDPGSIPRSGRPPGGGKVYPLQYSGLENSMDCIVHGVAKSQTQLSDFQEGDYNRKILGAHGQKSWLQILALIFTCSATLHQPVRRDTRCCGLNCAQSFSWVPLFVTIWTIVLQVPLSMGFSRQEYRGGFPFPTQLNPNCILPNSYIEVLSPNMMGMWSSLEIGSMHM